MASNAKKRGMEWRLPVMMAERRIRTATDLHRRLAAIGVQISSAQLTRLINDGPQRLSSELMYGLTEVLNCDASDLWRRPGRVTADVTDGDRKLPAPRAVTPLDETKARAQETRTAAKRAPSTGPKLSPYPKPKIEVGDGD